jgi:hypothetical protein
VPEEGGNEGCQIYKNENGKPDTEGVCPDCGAKVFRIGKG